MNTFSAGRLQQPPSPYTNTIRPPAFVATQPATVAVKMPPKRRSMPPLVFRLLQQAFCLDLTKDQSYMPLERTCLKEAVIYLRRHGHILIQGGSIHFGVASGGLYAKEKGSEELTDLTVVETLRLLKANYPLPQRAVRVQPDVAKFLWDNKDTAPSPEPEFHRPLPQAGFAFYSTVDYGTDLDTLPDSAWHVCTLNRAYQGIMFVGDIVVDEKPSWVWYSINHCRYVAQAIPSDILEGKV